MHVHMYPATFMLALQAVSLGHGVTCMRHARLAMSASRYAMVPRGIAQTGSDVSGAAHLLHVCAAQVRQACSAQHAHWTASGKQQGIEHIALARAIAPSDGGQGAFGNVELQSVAYRLEPSDTYGHDTTAVGHSAVHGQPPGFAAS